jgi:transposase-like protein
MRNRPSKNDLFKGTHFEQEIIVLCVRWYLRYKLSYRDLVEMMAERGVSVAHTTILRWVRRYAPEFDKRWSRFSVQAGTSWRVDQTYVKIRGQWAYLYRAVDSSGRTVDFRLSPRRNVASAKAFFRKAIRSQGRSPETITLDGYAASHRAVRELQKQGRLADLRELRSSKYLNNLIEQDHRNVKSRLGVMLGLKSFGSATVTIRGVELMHRIRKEQFDLRTMVAHGRTTPEIWAAVLAA